ncbi:MAG: pentapeptide repeat-containing protein [Deltaproteobacteria bacterium]|nr:pentapeptide repeat-containing protein [Deltaproteobacteria bacterium]
METALEIAAYALAITFGLGMLMLLLLVKDIFFHGRFQVPRPNPRKVPTTALDETRGLLSRFKALLDQPGINRDVVQYEIRHLEYRQGQLDEKAYNDHAEYFNAVRAWERAWLSLKDLHEELRGMYWWERRGRMGAYRHLVTVLERRQQEVDAELALAEVRDRLSLEELYTHGVLKPDLLNQLTQEALSHQGQPKTPAQTDAALTAAASGARPRAKPEPAPKPRPTTTAAVNSASSPPKPQPPPKPVSPATPPTRVFATPLTPSPLADQGILRQEDFHIPGQSLNARRYQSATFTLKGVPGERLQNADLSRSSFAGVVFTGVHTYERCLFHSCDLRRMELRDAGWPHTFLQCDLRGAALGQGHLAQVVFRECDLSGTQWRGARLDRVRFDQCRMDGVHWDGVDLSSAVMSLDMLATVDFTGVARLPQNHPQARPLTSAAPKPAPQAPVEAPAPQNAPQVSVPAGATSAPAEPLPPLQDVPDSSLPPLESSDPLEPEKQD